MPAGLAASLPMGARSRLRELLFAGLTDSFGLSLGWTLFNLLAVARGGLATAGLWWLAALEATWRVWLPAVVTVVADRTVGVGICSGEQFLGNVGGGGFKDFTALGDVTRMGGKVATTFYYSSSGGRTASAADVFGSTVPYLVSRPDPWDKVSPWHSWGPVLFGARTLQSKFGVDDRVEFRVGNLLEPVRSIQADVIIGDVSGIPDEIAASHCVALSRPTELADLLENYR